MPRKPKCLRNLPADKQVSKRTKAAQLVSSASQLLRSPFKKSSTHKPKENVRAYSSTSWHCRAESFVGPEHSNTLADTSDAAQPRYTPYTLSYLQPSFTEHITEQHPLPYT